MNIGIDVDGVLVDVEKYQMKYAVPFFSKKYNKAVVNPQEYDIEDIFCCSKKERDSFWHRYIWRYCLLEEVTENAGKVIRRLKKDGHRIVIITSRVYTKEKSFRGFVFRCMLIFWLRKNHIEYDEICFCSEKDSQNDKLEVCLKNKIDIMIDDKPENLSVIADRLRVICYPAIWNRDVDDNRFIRVSSWRDIYRILKNLN